MCFILFDSTKSRKQLIKQNGHGNIFLIFIFNSATILKARTDDYVLLQNLKMRKQHYTSSFNIPGWFSRDLNHIRLEYVDETIQSVWILLSLLWLTVNLAIRRTRFLFNQKFEVQTFQSHTVFNKKIQIQTIQTIELKISIFFLIFRWQIENWRFLQFLILFPCKPWSLSQNIFKKRFKLKYHLNLM